jgi:hypothetical protein
VAFIGTTISTQALKAATSTIPIVFAIGADPVNSGLVVIAPAAQLRPALRDGSGAKDRIGFEQANSERRWIFAHQE